MNFQRGDKGIGWTDATWNPVTGCRRGCPYCYARRVSERFGNSFEPTFHPERLDQPGKHSEPLKIFVCSMGELFGPWVSLHWIMSVLRVAEENPQHIFQFLTKYPQGYGSIKWPENAWVGVSITKWADMPTMALGNVDAPVRFVSAEPLLGYLPWVSLIGIDWLIIGAQSNPEKQPKREWVEDLLEFADSVEIPVFMKSNLDYRPLRREFPRGGGDE